VVSCRGLISADKNGKSDPYVKVSLCMCNHRLFCPTNMHPV
jgi:Ca2+-dependent lipid-binding protein